jgi:hypothetical protein
MDKEASAALLEESRRHLDATLDALTELDRKGIELIKIDAVVLGLIATAVGLLGRGAPSGVAIAGTSGRFLLVVGALGVAGLAASMGLAVVALFRRDIKLGVIRLENGIGLSYAETVRFAVETHGGALETNRASIHAKGTLVESAAAGLLIATALLAVSAVGFMILGGL